MPRQLPIVEHAMEAQSVLRRLRKDTAPMYAAALASGDYAVLQETHALAQSLRIAQAQAKRIAGMAEAACPDHAARAPGHGAAA